MNGNAPAVDDSGFLAQLMPNRGRAKLIRFAGWFCLVIAALGAISALRAISSSAWAHSHWPVVKGDILSYEQKSGAPPGSSSQHDVYWIEFRVEFDPGKLGCTTGSSWGVPSQFPCVGLIKTLGTSSWPRTMHWIERHPPNSAASFVYNPATGRLRFLDETAEDVYPPENLLIVLGAGGFGLLLLVAVQRRLRFLKNLPDDYDATPPPSSDEARPDELTDLKLP